MGVRDSGDGELPSIGIAQMTFVLHSFGRVPQAVVPNLTLVRVGTGGGVGATHNVEINPACPRDTAVFSSA